MLPQIISGIGGLIQGGIDALTSRSNTKKTIQGQKEIADKTYQNDLAMWEKGNKYNAPQAQMERLKSAGLNPNLVYGSGTVAGQSSGPLPHYQQANPDYSHNLPLNIGQGADKIAQYQDFSIKQAQTDNLRAQRNAIVAETELKKMNFLSAEMRNKYLDAYLSGRNTYQAGKISQQPAELRAKELGGDLQAQQLERTAALMPYQVDALKLTNKLNAQKLSQKEKMFPVEMRGKNLSNSMKARQNWLDSKYSNQQRKTQNDLGMQELLNKSELNSKIKMETEFERLQNEYYETKLFGNLGMDVLNQLGRQSARRFGKGQPKPKVNPNDKSWQKEFETHDQWMKRVNPGAK